MIERRLDRYLLREPIGSGGMAVVYLGHDTLLDREVAIKVMHPHLAGREESRRRFSREAQAVARLRHPSIVEIFDFSGDESDESFIVTELVKGRTLRAFGDEKGFFLPEVAALVTIELCDALAHAHGQGVIHRDLKPENVMVREDGALKLMDFGIAKMVGRDERMTLTGALMGSPHHMAPEIIEGREAEAPSDLFALGTILYWMVTGRMAFEGNNPTHALRQILESDYPDPRIVCHACPEDLAQVIARCLQRDPARRFSSAAELREVLLAFLAEVGIDRPKEELGAFFRSPEAHAAGMGERIRERLLLLAEEAVHAGRSAKALSHLDRLLALDPEDREARALLQRIRRAHRRRRRLGQGAAVAAGLLLVWAAFGWRTDPPPAEPPPEPPVTAAPAPREEPAEPPAEPAEVLPSPAPPPAKSEPVRPLPAPGPRKEIVEVEGLAPAAREIVSGSREVHLRWVPQGAALYLDGRKVDTLAPSWSGSLPAGTHRISLLHSACCYPYEEELEIRPGEEPLRRSIVLEPKESGWFEVDCEEPTAEVWLDGSFRGTVEEVRQRGGVAVAFSRNDSGRERYVKTVRFDLLPPKGADWPPARGEVVVRAGQRTRSEKLACAGLAAR